eukprot:TRINITY_DN2388_c0_g2_i5.p1 TRINITY_DN2388_c0_g2~~TRINITY_DN2388_c0_g2_i5.p1  ORF type:complete len:147 (+),score=12.78 TRINITY_DN2388_c0_g2_i5:37-441(+)
MCIRDSINAEYGKTTFLWHVSSHGIDEAVLIDLFGLGQPVTSTCFSRSLIHSANVHLRYSSLTCELHESHNLICSVLVLRSAVQAHSAITCLTSWGALVEHSHLIRSEALIQGIRPNFALQSASLWDGVIIYYY